MLILRAIWAAWVPIARAIGNFQARIILTVVYFVVLGPFALIAKRRGEPAPGSLWRERADAPFSLDGARREF